MGRAIALLEKAARAGQSAAAFRLGLLLARGESGVAKDPERALAYFRAAAAGGEAEASIAMGAWKSAAPFRRDRRVAPIPSCARRGVLAGLSIAASGETRFLQRTHCHARSPQFVV
jgi:TPR repeat protein